MGNHVTFNSNYFAQIEKIRTEIFQLQYEMTARQLSQHELDEILQVLQALMGRLKGGHHASYLPKSMGLE